MAAFATYMDESADGRNRAYAVAAYTSRNTLWQKAEDLWCIKLRKYNLAYYKAAECEYGDGQFTQHRKFKGRLTDEERKTLAAIRAEFLSIPVQCTLVGIGLAINLKEFSEVTRDPIAKDLFGGTPYYLAYNMAMDSVALAVRKARMPNVRTEFFCDSHGQCFSHLKSVHKDFLAKRPRWRKFMGDVNEKDDKRFAALQMADALAFEVRYKAVAVIGGDLRAREEWELMKKSMYRLDLLPKSMLLDFLRERGYEPPAAAST